MKRWMTFLVVLALVMHQSPAGAATRYSFTRLGAFGTQPTSSGPGSYAYDVNDLGHVVGYAPNAVSTNEAFIWDGVAMTGLGTLTGPASGATQSYAYGINDSDTVVGYSSAPGAAQAYAWQGGTMTGLGALGPSPSGFTVSFAYGINDTSLVVGASSVPEGYAAFIYTDSMSALAGLSYNTYARAINAAGDVAGYGNTAGAGPNRAFLWRNGGSVTWLGALGVPTSSGTPTSYAYGINDAAEAVGYSSSPRSWTEAFVWSDAQGMRALGDLPGGSFSSTAYGINNGGQVVGTSVSALGQEAFIWDAVQGMLSLNTLVDGAAGWVLREARAINNNGQIVGYGTNPSGGPEAFLLTPVTPAPVIAFSPASFTFSAIAGGPNPGAQALSISNSQSGTLSWAVSTSAGWLTLNPFSGQESGTVSLTVNIAGLAAGSYATNVQITGNAANSPQSVPVYLTVSAQQPPEIGFSPASLSWTLNDGSTSSTAQQLGVTNTGGGTLGYTLSASPSWISVVPASGAVASGFYSYADVGVNPSGQAPGTYTGSVTITGLGGASNSPQSVPVTMTILRPIDVTYPNGGETLHYGQNVVVTWDSHTARTVAKTDTYYTSNAGAASPTWKLIRSQTGLKTSCPWRVPSLGKGSSQCKVRVQFKDSAGAVIGEDLSNAAFSIVK